MNERDTDRKVIHLSGSWHGASRPDRPQVGEIDRAAILDGLFSLLEGTPGLAAITDTGGHVLYMNERGRRALGIPENQLRERRLEQIYPVDRAAFLQDQALPAAMKQGAWRGETALLDADGNEIPVSQVIIFQRATRDDGYFLSIAWDMRKQKLMESMLRYQATHDQLTGLPNRNLTLDRLAHAVRRSQREGTLTAVIFLDLDRFKEINDHFGHESANRILREAAQRLRRSVRSVDTVGRYGGDEFVIVLPDLQRPDEAGCVLDRVQANFRKSFPLGRRRLQVSASSGIAIYPVDGHGPDDLVRIADQAMYRHKRSASGGARREPDGPGVARYSDPKSIAGSRQ